MKKLIKSKKILFFFTLILGFLSSFSLPPFNYFIINFVTLSVFFNLIIKNKFLKTRLDYFLYGWFFGFGYFLLSLYWLTISLTFDADLKILIPIALVIIPGFLAIFFGVTTLVVSYFLKLRIISLILAFSVTLATFEYLRGTILTGFPWNLFVYSFAKNISFLQSLTIFGTYGLNLICITFFLIPTILILKRDKFEKLFLVSLFIIFTLFFAYGNKRLNDQSILQSVRQDFKVKVISSNINIDRFYDLKNEKKIIEQLINLSEPDKDISTIFIWPEGIFTSSFIKDIKKYKKIFEKNFGKNDLIIFGINDVQYKTKENIYNSLAVFDNNLNLKSLYYKNRLVPFGEFLPFENHLKKIGLKKITNNYHSFSRGTSRDIIELKNLKILPLICYEIIYTGQISRTNDYDLIINISEDGWFGNSIGISQHFYHSVFRSIEEGKNVIRSSNNGVTAIINPLGKILKMNESTEGGALVIDEFRKLDKLTLFSSHGNNIFFYLIAIYITLIFFLKRIGR